MEYNFCPSSYIKYSYIIFTNQGFPVEERGFKDNFATEHFRGYHLVLRRRLVKIMMMMMMTNRGNGFFFEGGTKIGREETERKGGHMNKTSITCCQVFVLPGMTKPKLNTHCSTQLPPKITRCSNRNSSIFEQEVKLISLETALLKSKIGTNWNKN